MKRISVVFLVAFFAFVALAIPKGASAKAWAKAKVGDDGKAVAIANDNDKVKVSVKQVFFGGSETVAFANSGQNTQKGEGSSMETGKASATAISEINANYSVVKVNQQ